METSGHRFRVRPVFAAQLFADPGKPRRQDRVELGVGNIAHGAPKGPLAGTPIGALQHRFVILPALAERDRGGEGQIVGDARIKAVFVRRIAGNTGYPGRREISLSAPGAVGPGLDAAWLIVDNPVAQRAFHRVQVTTGKVVSRLGKVVVFRPLGVGENSPDHEVRLGAEGCLCQGGLHDLC